MRPTPGLSVAKGSAPPVYTHRMHDAGASGLAFFKCDFCRRPWSDDRPMVEGHRGSLICAGCLTVAYTRLALLNDPDTQRVERCALCLEPRDQPGYASPLDPSTVACLRCIKQSATVLHKDPDIDWSKPTSA